jgi:hypothetical protein
MKDTAGDPVLGEPVKIRPIDARGRDRLGMRQEERAKRQSEMMKQRWARNRPEMLRKVIEGARQANLKKMTAAKPVQIKRPIKFDDAMRKAVRVPPPPSEKKAKRKVWRKKRRNG